MKIKTASLPDAYIIESEHESGGCYDDPKIGIKWPLAPTEISDKDKNHARLSQDYGGIQL